MCFLCLLFCMQDTGKDPFKRTKQNYYNLYFSKWIYYFIFLSFCWEGNCFAISNWHYTEHFFWFGFLKLSKLVIPTSSFKDETINISTFFCGSVNFFDWSFCDFSLDVKFIEFVRLRPADNLHNCSEEGLRIEESWNHNDFRNSVGIISECIELFNTLKEICKPGLKSSFWRIS